LDDGRHVRVRAAAESLMRATATDPHHLIRTAWHVGNRHLPCEIHADHLILRFDHVIAEMLEKLGADVEKLDGPFNPEGGAYGQGRTHSHEH
jgi:urease accessory protein